MVVAEAVAGLWGCHCCDELSAADDSLAGAEIEQTIIAARYSASAQSESLSTADIFP